MIVLTPFVLLSYKSFRVWSARSRVGLLWRHNRSYQARVEVEEMAGGV